MENHVFALGGSAGVGGRAPIPRVKGAAIAHTLYTHSKP